MSASDDTPKVEETPAASAAEESQKDEKPAAAAAAETVAKPDEGEKDKVSDEEKGPKSETEDKQAEGETSADEPAKPDDGPPIVLVTGALGYIASNVIHQLVQQGKYRVRGTLRSAKADNRLKALKQLVSKAQHPPEFVEADLLNENACNNAVRGCTYVLHVATAAPAKTPKREEDAVRPAAEGVKNVFKACVAAGTVKRVVVTSSIAAISNGLNPVESGKVHTEDDWSEEEHCTPYDKGKLRAERAALEFVKEAEESKKFELVVLCPSCVVGPVVIPNKMNPTLTMFEQILAKGAGFSDQFYPLVDVRDVAAAHLVAMERPDCAGHRCIVANKTILMKDIVSTVADEFGPQGFKINNKPARVSKLFGKKSGSAKPAEAKEMLYSTDRMKAELGVEARDVTASILDTCYALVDSGLVKKKKGYLGHPSSRPPKEEPKPKKDPKSKEEAKPKEEDTKAAGTAGQAESEESSATAGKSDGEKKAEAVGTAESKVEQPKPEESATKDEEPKKTNF